MSSTAPALALTSSASTAPAPAPGDIETEIFNSFALKQKLNCTIADLNAKRETGESIFAAALAKELAIAAVPLSVDTSPAFKNWKTTDGALEAKSKAAEEAFAAVDRHLCRLKQTQPEIMRALLQRKVEKLDAEITEAKAQLSELNKAGSKAKAANA